MQQKKFKDTIPHEKNKNKPLIATLSLEYYGQVKSPYLTSVSPEQVICLSQRVQIFIPSEFLDVQTAICLAVHYS